MRSINNSWCRNLPCRFLELDPFILSHRKLHSAAVVELHLVVDDLKTDYFYLLLNQEIQREIQARLNHARQTFRVDDDTIAKQLKDKSFKSPHKIGKRYVIRQVNYLLLNYI